MKIKKLVVKKDKIKITSDEGSGEAEVGREIVDIIVDKGIKDKLEGLNEIYITGADGFACLNEDVSRIINNSVGNSWDFCISVADSIEAAAFRSAKSGWKLIDKGARQIPRPMGIILRRKDGEEKTGISEFSVFSLMTKDFGLAMKANEKIYNLVKKKVGEFEWVKCEDGENREENKIEINGSGMFSGNLDDKKILDLVKACVDEVYSYPWIDFEIRIGVRFGNYKNGKYIYPFGNLNSDEQLDYVNKLIDDYDLAYVEDPFFSSDLDKYKILLEKVKHKCLVCISHPFPGALVDDEVGVHGAGSKGFFSAWLVSAGSFKKLKEDIKAVSSIGVHAVLDATGYKFPDILADLTVGYKFPLVKLLFEEESSKCFLKRINSIEKEIKSFRV